MGVRGAVAASDVRRPCHEQALPLLNRYKSGKSGPRRASPPKGDPPIGLRRAQVRPRNKSALGDLAVSRRQHCQLPSLVGISEIPAITPTGSVAATRAGLHPVGPHSSPVHLSADRAAPLSGVREQGDGPQIALLRQRTRQTLRPNPICGAQHVAMISQRQGGPTAQPQHCAPAVNLNRVRETGHQNFVAAKGRP